VTGTGGRADHRPRSGPPEPPALLGLPPGTPGGREAVAAYLRSLGVAPHAWSNEPFDEYAAHEHAYEKLLMCAAGSITFRVGPDERPVELHPGQGCVLPAGTRHAAKVGPDGCTCLEGHRPTG
jgi:mannose-6-phosphate isomerase-like protein (cupin superfamily)